jgi:hypothetical protein
MPDTVLEQEQAEVAGFELATRKQVRISSLKVSRHSSVRLCGCRREVWAFTRSYTEILKQQNDASAIFSGHYQRKYRQKSKIKRVKTVTKTELK